MGGRDVMRKPQAISGGHTDLIEPQESSGGHNDLNQPQGIPRKHDDMDELQDEITATASRSSREAFHADNIQRTIDSGNRYASLLAQSYHNMWEDEHDERPAVHNFELPTWLHITIPTLATMKSPVLNEIISSKIARPLRTNPSIAETVDFYQANCNKRPAIYSIEKERKTDEMTETIERFINPLNESRNPTSALLVHGRRYVKTANNHLYSAERLERIKVFCTSTSSWGTGWNEATAPTPIGVDRLVI